MAQRFYMSPDALLISKAGFNAVTSSDFNLLLSTRRKRLQYLEGGKTGLITPGNSQTIFWAENYGFKPFVIVDPSRFIFGAGYPPGGSNNEEYGSFPPLHNGSPSSTEQFRRGDYVDTFNSYGVFYNKGSTGGGGLSLYYRYSLYLIEAKP